MFKVDNGILELWRSFFADHLSLSLQFNSVLSQVRLWSPKHVMRRRAFRLHQHARSIRQVLQCITAFRTSENLLWVSEGTLKRLGYLSRCEFRVRRNFSPLTLSNLNICRIQLPVLQMWSLSLLYTPANPVVSNRELCVSISAPCLKTTLSCLIFNLGSRQP